MARESLNGKLAVILHADVADSTALVRQDEQLAHSQIQETFRRLEQFIVDYQGRVRELRGDALLAEFERASDAVSAALAFQSTRGEYLANLGDDICPEVRIGIALGEVIIADDTITGAGVVLAQRLEQLADRGGLVIQGAVYETIPERFAFDYEYLGDHEVKGFDDPVRAYRVEVKDGLPVPPPIVTASGGKIPNVRYRLALAAIPLLVAIVATLFWYEPWQPKVAPASLESMVLPLPDKPSIVVLPFENLGGDPGKDYLGVALYENVITELSRFKEFFVIARDSALAFKDQPANEVAENLGVRYIVKGSIQSVEGTVRVTAQLIDAVSGRHLWAERFDRDFEDVLTVQDEIARTVVSTIGQSIDYTERERAVSKSVANLTAVELRMRARELFLKFNKEDLQASIPLAERAIEIDPEYAEAYVHMAWAHVFGYRYGWLDTHTREESRELATDWAEKAVELDPHHYETRWALASALATAGQLDRARLEYDRALELNPNSSDVLADSTELLGYLGQAEEAVARLQQAMRLNPKHPEWYHWQLGWALYFAERYEEALASIEKTGTMPNGARRTLAPVLVRLGRIEEARAVMAEFLENEPEYSLEDMKVWPFKHKEYLERWTEDQRKAGAPELPPPELPDKPSIAVLPFTNMSGDPEQEYFADGMTEDLITDISKVSGLFVIARNSVFTYKGMAVKVQQVAEELGVRYVLEGSVRRAGNQVRINAQLVDATTGGHVWAERYDGSLADVFSLQDQVTAKIVNALSIKLTPQEIENLETAETSNTAAHDAYLQGLSFYLRNTPEDNAKAETYFKRAVELDPKFDRAYTALAKVYFKTIYSDYGKAMGKYFRIGIYLAYKNLAKIGNANFADAHVIRARIALNKHQVDIALQEAERALVLSSNDVGALKAKAEALVFLGRYSEGRKTADLVLRLDPAVPADPLYLIGLSHFAEGNYQDAVDYIERALEHNPTTSYFAGPLAAAYGKIGMKKESMQAFKTFTDSMGPQSPLTAWVVYVYPFQDEAVLVNLADGFAIAGAREGLLARYLKLTPETRLSGDEIKSLLFGHTIRGRDYWNGRRWTQVRTLEGKLSHSRGGIDTDGESWIEDDRVCDHWLDDGDEITLCSLVFHDPVKCWTNDKGLRRCGTIVPPEFAQSIEISYRMLTDQGPDSIRVND